MLAVERFLELARVQDRASRTRARTSRCSAVRQDERLALTVAMPLSCLRTLPRSAPTSRARKTCCDALGAALRRRRRFGSTGGSTASIVRASAPRASYLSLTGTSAEDADSGQVGRGNRANGLIAFSRPTGGEATAGKNPVAHAGKVYSVLSHRLARLIHARCPSLREVYGAPGGPDRRARGRALDRRAGHPSRRSDARGRGGRHPSRRRRRARRMPIFREELIRGAYPVC